MKAREGGRESRASAPFVPAASRTHQSEPRIENGFIEPGSWPHMPSGTPWDSVVASVGPRGTGGARRPRFSMAGTRINPPRLNQGWHTQFLTNLQKLNGFRELVACRVCSRYAAIALRAQNRPPGTWPKLACARPLSRRKTSSNGHKILSPDSSRHALQLCSYKRPPKRPLTRPNRP